MSLVNKASLAATPIPSDEEEHYDSEIGNGDGETVREMSNMEILLEPIKLPGLAIVFFLIAAVPIFYAASDMTDPSYTPFKVFFSALTGTAISAGLYISQHRA